MSIKRKQVYAGVVENEGSIYPVPAQKLQKRLSAGVYTVHVTNQGQLYFKSMSVNCDNIVDLPSPEYQQVMYDISTFLKPETKEAFDKYGFLYKRSALMYGVPGTGKTLLTVRIMNDVVQGGGVVLFNPDPRLMQAAFTVLDDIQPEVLTLVVFEEFDAIVRHHEAELLSLLDGEVQKSNVVYLATTNNKEKIPPRILRPGRFASLIEIKPANLEARIVFLKHKGVSEEEAADWAAQTEGFTIDELKEVVLSTKCLGYSLKSVLKRVQNYKNEPRVDEKAIKADADFNKVSKLFSEDDEW